MTKSKFDIILYGGPGSGKGTQAGLLLNKLKAITLNMGAELRKTAAQKTAIGREVAKYVNAGKIVPSKISRKIIRGFFDKIPATQCVIFDGYPRTITQVKTLDYLLKKNNREVRFLYIKLPVSVAKARLTKRAEIEGRRDDANPVAVKNRIDIFNKQAKKIIQHYKNSGRLVTINGVGSRGEVHKRIIKALS